MSFDTFDYNTEELHPPTWLNKDFFHEVLRSSEKQQTIEIEDLKIMPATTKYDHYASVIFRIFVKFTTENRKKEKSMILKTMPEKDGDKKHFLEDSQIFETEISMYTQIIPKFEEILRDAGDNTKLGPPCIFSSLSPRKVIIFEDMVQYDYTVLRSRQTNFEESKAVYAKIAKWHAVSYKLNLEQPDFFREFHSNAFVKLKWKDNEFFKAGITNFIEMLDEHDDLRQYKQYFQPLEHKIMDYVEETFSEYTKNPELSNYYVLCHGDFHHRNMLFKYDRSTSNLLDVLLIDYQMCYVGPIVNDIINSIFMLIDSNQRLENLDELLHYYFSIFQETLIKVGFTGPMPKMIEFRNQMVSHRHYALFLFSSLPIMYALHSSKFDVSELSMSVEKRKAVFNNPVYVDEMRKLLRKYLHLGYLGN